MAQAMYSDYGSATSASRRYYRSRVAPGIDALLSATDDPCPDPQCNMGHRIEDRSRTPENTDYEEAGPCPTCGGSGRVSGDLYVALGIEAGKLEQGWWNPIYGEWSTLLPHPLEPPWEPAIRVRPQVPETEK